MTREFYKQILNVRLYRTSRHGCFYKGLKMATTIKCTARRMAGGAGHEHISHLWWDQVEESGKVLGSGVSTRDEMVAYIEKNGNYSVWCPDRNPQLKGAWVHVTATVALSTFRPSRMDARPTTCCHCLRNEAAAISLGCADTCLGIGVFYRDQVFCLNPFPLFRLGLSESPRL